LLKLRKNISSHNFIKITKNFIIYTLLVLNIFALTKPQNILIMETKDRLQKYKFENYTIVTNFESIKMQRILPKKIQEN
jgi:hypothetical protein